MALFLKQFTEKLLHVFSLFLCFLSFLNHLTQSGVILIVCVCTDVIFGLYVSSKPDCPLLTSTSIWSFSGPTPQHILRVSYPPPTRQLQLYCLNISWRAFLPDIVLYYIILGYCSLCICAVLHFMEAGGPE